MYLTSAVSLRLSLTGDRPNIHFAQTSIVHIQGSDGQRSPAPPPLPVFEKTLLKTLSKQFLVVVYTAFKGLHEIYTLRQVTATAPGSCTITIIPQ